MSNTDFNFLIDLYLKFSNLLNILPYSLIISSLMQAIFFSDIRGFLLFSGSIFNEILIKIISFFGDASSSVNRINKCEIFKNSNMSLAGNFGYPSAYMQRIGFFAGFILADNIYYKKYNPIIISCIVFTILGLFFHLISKGCSNLVELVSGSFIGLVAGIIYFFLVKNYFKEDISYSTDDDFVCETVEVEV